MIHICLLSLASNGLVYAWSACNSWERRGEERRGTERRGEERKGEREERRDDERKGEERKGEERERDREITPYSNINNCNVQGIYFKPP